jgi:predicted homoserine dehydrogenase-like protein
VLSECTSSIYEAFLYCQAAIARKAHVVLMNAEVDLFLGSTLARQAEKMGVVVTSDAGDQHGVLATMIDEVELWGFKIMQAGNMKGFQKVDADEDHARPWAEKQQCSVKMTLAYTDGTKMNIENAIVGNYANLIPLKPGGEGPKIKSLEEIFNDGVFSLDQYGDQGRVDYTLEVPFPGGGVYVIGHCDDAHEDFLLKYYKVINKRPYYCFFRPYHLCHLETPRAIAQAYFDHRPVISPPLGDKLCDVYAYTKRDLKPGDVVGNAIGGNEFYGLVDATAHARADQNVPIYYLEAMEGKRCVIKRPVAKGTPLRWDDVEIPDSAYRRLLMEQNGF